MYSNNSKVQSPRKKKRKYSIDNNLSASSSTSIGFNLVNSSISEAASRTVNIIDRILDFSKFSNADQADLYSLSRDWLRATNMEPRKKPPPLSATNNPEPMNIDSANNADEHSQSSTISSDAPVTKLPEPVYTSQDVTCSAECIASLNENIAREIRASQEHDMELVDALNGDQFVETHALLKLHVGRWKKARRKWIEFYHETNKPYQNSSVILKSIFEEMQ